MSFYTFFRTLYLSLWFDFYDKEILCYLADKETVVIGRRAKIIRFIHRILWKINLILFNKYVSTRHGLGTVKDAKVASVVKKDHHPCGVYILAWWRRNEKHTVSNYNVCWHTVCFSGRNKSGAGQVGMGGRGQNEVCIKKDDHWGLWSEI